MRKGWVLGIALLLFISIGSPCASAEPPASLALTIPDYTVTTIGNLDYVDIPGGEILITEEGRPRVPYYIKSIDYPKGYRVQNVVLKERSGLMTATGLRLPVVILSQYPKLPIEMKKGWYPEEDYEWRVWDNLNGSTTLVITLYPFYYNPETTDVKFYKNYHIDIEYIMSDVEITALYLDKDIYVPGDEVRVDIRLNNHGEMQNVVVSVVIKRYGSDELVDGLPLRLLRNLAGDASLTVEWDSGNAEAGSYYAEVTLTDTEGNVLDRKAREIGLVIPYSELESPRPETPTREFPTKYVILAAAIAGTVAGILALKGRRKKAT